LPFYVTTSTSQPETYTLSLHDALPISGRYGRQRRGRHQAGVAPVRACEGRSVPAARSLQLAWPHDRRPARDWMDRTAAPGTDLRSEEHTSELQSRGHLVCRLLLEKKNS